VIGQRRQGEEGFALITVMWLLLLSGSIVALMMLKSHHRAQLVKGNAASVQAEFDADAALETVMTDLLFRGNASTWSRLPSAGAITLDGRSVSINLSAEKSRLDLALSDLNATRLYLQGRVSPARREAFLAELQRARAQKDTVDIVRAASLLELLGDEGCPAAWFTIYGDRSAISVSDANLTGGNTLTGSSASSDTTFRMGIVVRINITSKDGYTRAMVRPVGRIDRAFDLLSSNDHASCHTL
jgi:hypothetical protein